MTRTRMRLDLLHMIWRQKIWSNRGFNCFLYLAADASPKANREWFVVEEDSVNVPDAVKIFEMTQMLCHESDDPDHEIETIQPWQSARASAG
eukprot:551917-Pyramimonas_sp.AAC.1